MQNGYCTVPREEAIQILKDSILQGDTLWVRAYIHPDSIQEGKTISSASFSYINPYHLGWFFFIDDCPPAYWAHPCRYIFLNDERYYSISTDDWYPNSWQYFTDTLELIIDGVKISRINESKITQDTLTMQDAIAILIDSILEGDTADIDLYINPEPGDSMVSSWNFSYITPYSNGWFFFIDDAPPANWTHPCRYLFLSDFQYLTYYFYNTIIREMSPPDNIDSLKMIISHGIDENIQEVSSSLSICPNPFRESFKLTSSGRKRLLKIYDLSGRLVESISIPANQVQIMVGDKLNPGVYYLKTEGTKPAKVVKLK